jgi:putative peptidoglycan lipid II flippase
VHKASVVAAGILGSRLAGLVRLRVFAHYFGLQSEAADAFNAAFRIPNFLQNLFGEGALSASFIPVYARLVSRGDAAAARQVAGAVAALLGLTIAVLVLMGVLAAPLLTAVLAPGFTGSQRDLTTALVRILFPGAGLLALSAWCLGVLNSHHRFLLSYAAPVAWNGAMIGTLVIFGPGTDTSHLAILLAWGSVVGSALQLAVQLPGVGRLTRGIRFHLDLRSAHVRTVVRTFVPALMGRGVVQVSAFIDTLIATWLPTGAVTGLANAQLLFTLPISLFGISVAAAELPAMAGDAPSGGEDGGRGPGLRIRLETGFRRIAFFVVPTTVLFLVLGDLVASAFLQTGRFRPEDGRYVWTILAGSSVGLLAATIARLCSSAYYALGDTRTPVRYALVRVGVATTVGYVLALVAPGRLGIDASWGAAGLTLAGGLAAWIELFLLKRTLSRRLGAIPLPVAHIGRLVLAALTAGVAAWATRGALPSWPPVVLAVPVFGVFGLVYLATAAACRVSEARAIVGSLRA